MKRLKNLSLRVKLLGMVTGMLLLVGGCVLWMFNNHVRDSAKAETLGQARKIVDFAESVRDGMESKWKKGVFDAGKLSDWAKEGEVEKVLAAVPIVSAWEAAMARAEEGGYKFRTPRVNPRNPDNEPDKTALEALAYFEESADNTEYSAFDAEHNTLRYFRPIRLTNSCMICHGNPDTSLAQWGNANGIDATGFRMDNSKVGDLHAAFEVVQSLDKADAQASAVILQGALIILGILIVSCSVLAWLLEKLLVRPLTAATASFTKLVNGDLREQLCVTSQDEVGRLQAGINSLIQRLRTIVGDLKSNGTNLGEVSHELASSADRVEVAINDTKQRSTTVAAAAEEMSVAMHDMRTSLRNVSVSVQTVAAATSQVNSNAGDVTRATDDAAAIARRASELAEFGGQQIRNLEGATQDIGKIVSVIQDIAEQTNLLALNATIESSRAGEAGKGFAVVAEEVKTLARQTAEATASIREQIDSIQGMARTTVNSIEQIVGVAAEVNAKTGCISTSVEEQKNAIRSLSDQLNEIARHTETLNLTVEQTVTASTEVAEQVAKVEMLASDTSREAESSRAASLRVKDVTGDLEGILGTFAV